MKNIKKSKSGCKVEADGEVLFKSPTYEESRIVIVFKTIVSLSAKR